MKRYRRISDTSYGLKVGSVYNEDLVLDDGTGGVSYRVSESVCCYPELWKLVDDEPKVGDKVMAWDECEHDAERVILIAILPEHAKYRYVVVEQIWMKEYNDGDEFYAAEYRNVKPIPKVKEITMAEITEKFGCEIEITDYHD